MGKEMIKIIVSLWRLIPAYCLLRISGCKSIVLEDVDFWNELFGRPTHDGFTKFGLLLWDFREFRNVVAARIISHRSPGVIQTVQVSLSRGKKRYSLIQKT